MMGKHLHTILMHVKTWLFGCPPDKPKPPQKPPQKTKPRQRHPRYAVDLASPSEIEQFRKRFAFQAVTFNRNVPQAQRTAWLTALHVELPTVARAFRIPLWRIGWPEHDRPITLEIGTFPIDADAYPRERDAQYCPATHTIQLRQRRGAGAFVHEWGHAVDLAYGGGLYWSENWTDWMEFVERHLPDYLLNAETCDGRRGPYYALPRELFARAVEWACLTRVDRIGASVAISLDGSPGVMLEGDELHHATRRIGQIVRDACS